MLTAADWWLPAIRFAEAAERYELGSIVARSVDVSRAARPYLDALASETGESVLLGILDGGSVLYLDRGDSPNGFHMVATAGRRSPLHATASGKLLRRDGYATCWQERELGLCSVAVPLRDHTGATVASLTLVGPAGRLTPESADEHLAPLRSAAHAVEEHLGVDGGGEGSAA